MSHYLWQSMVTEKWRFLCDIIILEWSVALLGTKLSLLTTQFLIFSNPEQSKTFLIFEKWLKFSKIVKIIHRRIDAIFSPVPKIFIFRIHFRQNFLQNHSHNLLVITSVQKHIVFTKITCSFYHEINCGFYYKLH